MLNKKEKKGFINAVMECTKDSVLSSIDGMPAGWEAMEIRQYIADALLVGYKMKGDRLKEYRNTVSI